MCAQQTPDEQPEIIFVKLMTGAQLADEMPDYVQMALGFMWEVIEAVENGLPLTEQQIALVKDAMLYADLMEQLEK